MRWPLIPMRYRGRVGSPFGVTHSWATHYVCCWNGEAWDPLFEVPVPLGGYARDAFGEELAIETFVGSDRIRDYCADPRSVPTLP